MTQFPSTPNLAKAVIALIKAVGPIAKNSEIGTGKNAYKGVSDKDVKEVVGKALAENQLCLLPIDVIANESTYLSKDYNGNDKVNFFTAVNTKYLLLHESGESVVLTGYGHGVDTQDKAAGKATTYALKYLLLYLSMAATGGIDDADAHHSDSLPPRTVVPPGAVQTAQTTQITTPTPSGTTVKVYNNTAVQNFEKEKPVAPVQTPVTSAPAHIPGTPVGKHNLIVNDEKWPRVLDWVIMNQGKGLAYIVSSLKKNNDFGSDVEKEIENAIK